ncbi:unnamed protein product [Allacma fusca]|uniref:PLAC domain-containing protein n=1 Tax=Allacma fusca TaxID=39272 RepID=A0A8J2KQ87_9HEXA|nr:unnamed protein product [Allacma fusca]
MVKDTPPAFQAEPTVRSTNTRVNIQDESRPQAAALTLSQGRTQSQPSLNFSNEPNEEPDDSECTDQYRNCPLVVQARLCRYKYYRSVCCSACTENWHTA